MYRPAPRRLLVGPGLATLTEGEGHEADDWMRDRARAPGGRVRPEGLDSSGGGHLDPRGAFHQRAAGGRPAQGPVAPGVHLPRRGPHAATAGFEEVAPEYLQTIEGAARRPSSAHLCAGAPSKFTTIARFQDGRLVLFEGPPPQQVGLDASYEIVDDHTFTASDAGQNINGTYTFNYRLEGDRLTAAVDAYASISLESPRPFSSDPVGCRNSFMQLVGGTRGADRRADPAGAHGADPR